MNVIIVIVLSALLMVGGFMQGLFFDKDFYSIAVVATGLYAVVSAVALRKGELRVRGGGGKRAALALLLPAVLAISLVHAESVKATLDQIVRFTTYGCIFLLLRQVRTRVPNARALMLAIVQASGAALGIAAWLGYAGWLPSAGTVVAGRMAGALQYPNTFGGVSALLLLVSLLLLVGKGQTGRGELGGAQTSGARTGHAQTSGARKRRSLGMLLQAAPLGVHASGLLLSQSRGAMLALAAALLIASVLLPLARQLALAAAALAALGCAFAAALLLPPQETMAAAPSAAAPLVLAAASLIAAGLGAAAARAIAAFAAASPRFARLAARPHARLAVPAGALLLAALAALDLMRHGLLYASLPASWKQSIAALAQTDTLRERLIMLQDAMALVRTSPLFGHGWGSWRILFTQVQQTPYESGEIHNGWVEWLVSAGTIGLAAFAAMMAAVLIALARQWKRGKADPLPLAAMTGLLLVLLHSLTDFDLSFGYVWLLLIWLIAAALPAEARESQAAAAPAIPRWRHRAASLAFALLALASFGIASLSITANTVYAQLTDRASTDEAIAILKRANALDRFQAVRELQLAGAFAVRYITENGNKDDAAAADRALRRAIALEPHNASLLQKCAAVYYQIADANQAIRLTEQALGLDRFNAALYGEAERLRVNAALLASDSSARQYGLQSALQHYERNRLAVAEFHARMPESDWHAFNGRGLRMEPAAAYYGAIAAYLLGRDEDALTIVSTGDYTDDVAMASRAAALEVVVLRKQGKTDQAEEQYQADKDRFLSFDDAIASFESLTTAAS
ncbi:O-antigen ligase family protein [Paenibacillus rhizovicinus]|uniref:O-antigen ligase family protein n=1 Tax=Paenibacillus rhizovicinus TaxID=2704463 RepID=A0A6C0P090_9BACL|nr:O-antigen ligase family protein [Paenibacillus rhizovicinus]QHW31940.1 O-antigen ligase family protein [Paenibacillus rhizovicinus]